MTKLTQPINSAVAEMAADKLLNFQLMIRDIPGILRLTFGEPGFDVDDKIKQATIDAVMVIDRIMLRVKVKRICDKKLLLISMKNII